VKGKRDILSAGDVAEIMGWSRTTAWEWMKRQDQTFITRRGPKKKWMGITRENLAVLAASADAPPDPRLTREIAEIREQVRNLETISRGMANDIRALRRSIPAA
jgi:predicted DNA-binding transcriptional regulator AlpA